MEKLKLKNGAEVEYIDIGGGPVVVLIHGFTGGKWYYEPTIEALKDKYRVIAMDLTGHGESDKPTDKPYSVSDYVLELDEILTHLGVSTMVLGGHSMGGFISLQYVVDKPSMRNLRGLILLATAPAMVKNKFIEDRLDMMKEAFKKGEVIDEKVGRQMARFAFGPGYSNEEIINKAFDEGMKVPDEIKIELFEALLYKYDVREELKKINIPAAVLTGDKDLILAASRGLKQLARLTMYEEMPGSGHMLNWELTKDVNANILKFLRYIDY